MELLCCFLNPWLICTHCKGKLCRTCYDKRDEWACSHLEGHFWISMESYDAMQTFLEL